MTITSDGVGRGAPKNLVVLGSRYGFSVEQVPPVVIDDSVVSSSADPDGDSMPAMSSGPASSSATATG